MRNSFEVAKPIFLPQIKVQFIHLILLAPNLDKLSICLFPDLSSSPLLQPNYGPHASPKLVPNVLLTLQVMLCTSYYYNESHQSLSIEVCPPFRAHLSCFLLREVFSSQPTLTTQLQGIASL